jgi:hypothetical protein
VYPLNQRAHLSCHIHKKKEVLFFFFTIVAAARETKGEWVIRVYERELEYK